MFVAFFNGNTINITTNNIHPLYYWINIILVGRSYFLCCVFLCLLLPKPARMILDTIPYSTEKNLGKAYNRTMSLLGDNDHACLRDGDTCWLTPDYGVHLAEYVRLYPNAVLTCWTNRINERAEQQSKAVVQHQEIGHMPIRECTDMTIHLRAAEIQKESLYNVTPLHGFISGFCMVVPKSVWNVHKFAEVQPYEDRGPHALLGIDNDFTNRIRAAGVPVLRMEGLYLWHTYRLLTNSKAHLL